MRSRLALAVVLAAAAAAPAAAEPPVVLTGGAIPRLDPFTVRAVPCDGTSCLEIVFRARGDIGPRLGWEMTVVRPDGGAVYRGGGITRRGRRVAGLLEPARPPACGRYRVTVRIEDRDGVNLQETRIAVRRRGCVPPRPPAGS